MSTYIANIINLKKLKRFYNLEQSDRSSFKPRSRVRCVVTTFALAQLLLSASRGVWLSTHSQFIVTKRGKQRRAWFPGVAAVSPIISHTDRR